MSEPSAFEWVGGAPCLDFHNTVTWAGEGMVNERLASYQDLVAWGREAGLLSQRAAERLVCAARGQPEAAQRSLEQAHELRDLLHEVMT
ncbi:MAG: ABATE domain-containing protein, partial [Gemmatimonadales bacterium]